MFLTHLSLTNFRKFTRLDCDIPTGAILIVGENAEGKTSLLEAIYYLATFFSFQASSDRVLINFIEARKPPVYARIVADYCYSDSSSGQSGERTGSHQLEIRLIQEESTVGTGSRLRREVLLDGVKRKLGEVIGSFNAVIFLPYMMRVIEGAPEDRRRYLNLVISQVYPSYALNLSEYNRILSQRNALLKRLYEKGGDWSLLDFWDVKLSEIGAKIIHLRSQVIQELEGMAARIHDELTQRQERLRLVYKPAYEPLTQESKQYVLPFNDPIDRSRLSEESIRRGFLESLNRQRGTDVSHGLTTLGPHRDDLRLLSNQIDLSVFGSRGQGRTTMLSLKIAESEWMHEKTGQWPVLLLDEVLAELDSRRRSDLLKRFFVCEQILLTTTELDIFSSSFIQKAKVWRIEAGRVRDI